jgi:predicted phosphodiesterase
MKLAWVTDPHIDPTTEANLRRAMRAGGQVDAAVCTGDLSSAPRLREHLHQLREALRCPVYFVLGNHDYYGGGLCLRPGEPPAPPGSPHLAADVPPCRAGPGRRPHGARRLV